MNNVQYQHVRVARPRRFNTVFIGVGLSFFQYSITPTLQKYVEQSKVMESSLPEGKPKPGFLDLDSFLPIHCSSFDPFFLTTVIHLPSSFFHRFSLDAPNSKLYKITDNEKQITKIIHYSSFDPLFFSKLRIQP